MNKVIMTGNIVRDMDLSYSASGTAYLRNAIAVNDSFKRDVTYFHNFVAFGKRAETMAQYLKKGSRVLIEGQLTTSEYERDGQKRTSTSISVDNFEFLDRKSDSQGGSNNNQGNYSQNNQSGSYGNSDPFNKVADAVDISSQDLPF